MLENLASLYNIRRLTLKIINKFKQKRPVISFEIFPPKKDSELKNIDATLEVLSELNPDYISVTFGAGGGANNNRTIELAKKIKYDYDIEPLIHLTSLHYDKTEIESLTSELKVYGLDNILALRGDKNPRIEEKDVFKYASDLVEYLHNEEDFCLAGACYPESHPESLNKVSDIQNLKNKVTSGVDFLISQMFFDNEMYYKFLETCQIASIDVPITAGIMPVINKKQIERMVTLCGASLPIKFQRILRKFEYNKEALFDAGMAYAGSQIIDLLANDVDGIHLYTMNNPVVAQRTIALIKNLL